MRYSILGNYLLQYTFLAITLIKSIWIIKFSTFDPLTLYFQSVYSQIIISLHYKPNAITMSKANMEKIKVLYVDDEKINLQAFRTTFKKDYEILLASSAKEARQLLSKNKVDIIITDQRMPQETGIEFFLSIKEVHPEPIRLLLTAYSDIQIVQDALESGLVYHYLTKPWEEKYFNNIIRNAFEAYVLRKQVKELQKELLMVRQDLELSYRQNQIT